MRFRFLQWDFLGISISVLCAVHCVLLPLIFSSLSLMGATLLHNRWLEAAMIAGSFVTALLSFYKGCFAGHKSKAPLLLFIAGFGLLLLNQLHEAYTFYLIPAAAVLMIWAHYSNYRRCRQHCALVAPAKPPAKNKLAEEKE